MIDARTAREGTTKIRTNTLEFVMGPVFDQIQKAMENGRYGIAVSGNFIPQHLHSDFKSHMQQLGYEVEHYTGDQRDPADQWNISWRKEVTGASKLG